jgi:hypothetical protein
MTMARQTCTQLGLFDPAPPPLLLPPERRADLVTLLRLLLTEAVAPSAAPNVNVREETGDDQDHA